MTEMTTEGLPEHALERLKGMREQGNQEGVFTSDLSVNEYLLVRESGFEPVGLVMGSSVYHIGFQRGRWKENMEMDVLTQALYEARELAIKRMDEEAHALGADGVVGVKLRINRYEWGPDVAEFIAIGTAVVARDPSLKFKNKDDRPFSSDLTGQDFWTLLKAGYRPLFLAMGTCVYHIAHQGMMEAMANMGKNIELSNYTQALYDARELAMGRMQKDAHEAGADGVVGVKVREGSYGWSSNVIEFFTVGTAVIPISAEHHIETPDMVMILNDRLR